MIDKQSYRDQLGVDPDFKGFEIFRTDDNISASKVRNALKIDDEKTFKKMTPKSIHSFYKPLQNILEPIKENTNMKNLKGLNEFSVNESTEDIKINEEYIELMPGMEEGLEQIVEGWIEWKGGPATEKTDIAPARKELLNFCTTYLKKNIK
jgi:hypothetical protein